MPNVDVIVSPYEADAQLAFLTNNGLADAVITEDSDLIAFGCAKVSHLNLVIRKNCYGIDSKRLCYLTMIMVMLSTQFCFKIIFKFVAQSGECTIYDKDKLSTCFSGEMSSNFDFAKFRRVCILSGCDYLQVRMFSVCLWMLCWNVLLFSYRLDFLVSVCQRH